MSAQAALLILYGVGCPSPCAVSPSDIALLERTAVQLLAGKGFEVRPAPPDAPRPTGSTSTSEATDVAKIVAADRVVAIDLEHDGRRIWVTQFVSGVVGAWAVDKADCEVSEKGVFECRSFERILLAGLRPRTALDVDVVSALRAKARAVGKCVAEEDQVRAEERIFGRVEMDLVLTPDGAVKVSAIAPARVAKARLGKCLAEVMQSIDVGSFTGAPITFSVPLDL